MKLPWNWTRPRAPEATVDPAPEDSAPKAAAPASGDPAPEAKEAIPAKETDSSVPSGVAGWIGALQITLGLAGAGFVGQLSVQQFLGVDFSNWSAHDLSLFAGHWAFDTIQILLTQLLDRPLWFGIPILIYLLPPVLALSLPTGHKAVRLATLGSIAATTVGLIFVLVWIEMPTLTMNNWLDKGFQENLQPRVGHILSGRVTQLTVTRMVASMDGVAFYDHLACSAMALDEAPKELQAQLHADKAQKNAGGPVGQAQTTLQADYSIAVIVCLVAWLILCFHPFSDERVLYELLLRATRILVSFLLLPLATAMLPFAYGRLIYSTQLPLVHVIYPAQPGVPPDDKKASAKPALAPARAEGAWMLLLDQNDSELSLVPILKDSVEEKKKEFRVEIRRRSEIAHMEREGSRDILNELFLRCTWLPGMDATKR